MQELIKDIIIFSKVSNEKENLFLKTNINQLVSKVLEDLDAPVKDKKARDSVRLLPNLIINPVLIKSLFLNLIGNAIKYSKKNVPPYKQITAEIPQSAPFPTNKKVNNFCRTIINIMASVFSRNTQKIFSTCLIGCLFTQNTKAKELVLPYANRLWINTMDLSVR